MLNLHACFTKGTIEFRLFQFDNPSEHSEGGINCDQMKAYIQLCLAMSELAKRLKYASPIPQQTENEKYAFRCWMLRLGFIGEEFNTPVLIWKISEQDERSLDRYEGFPLFYVKKNLKVAVKSLEGFDIGTLTAMVYIMTPEAVKLRDISPLPSRQYYLTLCTGYKTFGFDGAPLVDALNEAKDFETQHLAKSSR